MPLDGVVPFPPEFAARYRERGYWRDRPLRDEFDDIFDRYADRVAVISGDERITYRQVKERSEKLALNLLDLGLRPLDRVVVTLPNVPEFVYLHFALQKIGAIPICALPSHRYHEIRQFVTLADAAACVVPDRLGDFDFPALIARIQGEAPSLKWNIVAGSTPEGAVSLAELLTRQPARPASAVRDIHIDPTDPAVFQLSGGTTGIPKLIPRTHNDYFYNSTIAVEVNQTRDGDVLLLVIPIEHNLPLACPGLQGFFIKGLTVVLSTTTRPADVFRLIQEHKITHLEVVPALLIRWINDPAAKDFDLSSVRVIQSGGQRFQPEIRRQTEQVFPTCTVQENFGMSEGLLMFVRLDDPEEVRMETSGRPLSPDDEVKLLDEDDNEVPMGEVGELTVRGPYTLRGYFRAPEHNARAFTPDGFYRSGDLMRMHRSGNYIVEGRKKDLINRGGEKISAEEIENLILMHPAVQNVACVPMPDPILGEKTCAYVILRSGHTSLTLPELTDFLLGHELAKFKLPERLEIVPEFPLSPFGKVSKKDLTAQIAAKVAAG
ncbi:MAG TPA: AMP-binding protein [Chloroflexota bacterium]|nr:AMP-binding protein [Chloroflexota bacterium]